MRFDPIERGRPGHNAGGRRRSHRTIRRRGARPIAANLILVDADVTVGGGCRIDPAAAVAAHPLARAPLAQPQTSKDLRRAAIRAALLLARPERASDAPGPDGVGAAPTRAMAGP